MKIKGAIFDLDGTLLDSMFIWDSVGEQYLRSIGICPEDDINQVIKNMSMAQGAAYIQKAYGVEKTSEEIIAGANAIVEHFYMDEVQLKDGVRELLQYLAENEVKMCIATATDQYLVEAALTRLGVEKYFTQIFTCSEVGHGKDEPHVYEAACRQLGTPKEHTLIFEDAVYAIETAKTAGFAVAGVFDASEKNQEKVQEITDFYITDFRKFQGSQILERSVRHMKTALTIAGSDSCGGAGIQADIKTMTTNGVYAMSAITALTAQNTTGVQGIFAVTPEFLGMQIDSVCTDIRPDAVKIGMVSSAELIGVIAQKLTQYQIKNIVVDPVMVATSGAKLISEDAIVALKEKLLPLATLVTPNIPEAEVLTGMEIKNSDDMIRAAEHISKTYHCAVLCKGGHSLNDANDLLYANGEYRWFYGRRIDNPNTHGTGCTLSSAIASNLAKGQNLFDAVENAKEYISGALSAMLDLGAGSGPMNHAFDLKEKYL